MSYKEKNLRILRCPAIQNCPLRTCFHLERPMTRAEENSDRAA